MKKACSQRSLYGFLLCLLLLFTCNAYAWFDSGHMIIAQIAYDQLTEDTRTQVNALLKELANIPPSYSDFLRCATWMDGIKSTGLEFFNDLHYVDRYYMVGNVSAMPAFEKRNVVWAIQEAVSTLKNPGASAFARALALRFLIHTVGDVHQPLHAATLVSPEFPTGDVGGNRFTIQPTGPGKYTQLHALWDSGVLLFPHVTARTPNYAKIVSDATAQILKSVDISRLQAQIQLADPWIWADESFQIAKQITYQNIKVGDKPSDSYIQLGQATVAERVVLGGCRLANLLNSLFSITAATQ